MSRKSALGMTILIAAAYGLVFMHRQSITPFLPELVARFDTGYAGAGGLVSAMYIAFAVSLLPSGWLADRISARILIPVGCLAAALGTAGLALSPSYGYAMASRVLTGIAIAICLCPTVRQISGLAPDGGRGLAMSIREVAVALGMIGGLTALPWLARVLPLTPLLLWACVPLVIAAVAVAAIPRSLIIPPSLQSEAAAPGLGYRLLWLGPIAWLTFGTLNGLLSWLPTLLRLHHGLDGPTAGLVMAGLLSFMIPCTLIAGLLSDRLGLRSGVVAVGSALVAVGCLGLLYVGSWLAIWGAAGLTAAGWGATASLVMVMAAEAGGPRAGIAVGVVSALAQGSSAVSSYALGWLVDVTGGFVAPILALTATASINAVACIAAGRALARHRPAREASH